MSGRAAPQRLVLDVGEGLRLGVVRDGSGPPVLALHGFTGSAETWEPLREALGGRYDLAAVDLPGHGRSSAPADAARYALPRLADDLARLLDVMEIGRAAVLGYSLGGRAALHLAHRHADRVAALILESASPGIADPSERAARARDDDALAGFVEREGVEAFVDRWERLPLWASQAPLPAEVREGLRAQRLRNRVSGLAGSLRGAGAGAEPSLEEALGALHTPTLLLAGALDAKYVAIGERMAKAIPGARLQVVPGAGHAIHLERPAAFAELVGGFLGSLPPRGRQER